MKSSVIVLGTVHQVQGGERVPGTIQDRHYAKLISNLLEWERVDFVFEEIGGLGPTTAEHLTVSRLGRERYLDVDPPRGERTRYGIPLETAESCPVDPYDRTSPMTRLESVEAHDRREQVWVDAISSKSFKSGLMICGDNHTLSLAFRLRPAGFEVRTVSYIPYSKLCGRQH